MSTILNGIKNVIAGSIKVETKSPVNRAGKTRFPILVTDVSQSFTSGWFVQYNPVAQDNGTRLYDGAETFSELHIARFSHLKQIVETANYYFLQGVQVETLSEGRKRAIYELEGVRLTATSQSNSVSVVVTIVDEKSPFHMLSIPFTVVLNNSGDGSYHVIGSDTERWDRNTDTFKEFNANFAPRKGRFYRVQQQQNQPATLRAKIAVKNGQYAINYDGTFEVDTKSAAPDYIQVITNEYKALAYIYEQALMAKAFEMALAQGLPTANPIAPNTNAPIPPAGASAFVPAFNLGNAGQPAPVPQQQAPAPVQQQVPAPQSAGSNLAFPAPAQTPAQTPVPSAPAGVSAGDLPWETN